MSIKHFLFCIAVCLLMGSSAWAKESVYTQTQVEIMAQYEAVSPQTPIDVLVKIKPHAGWHIYWDNPGDTGTPTKVLLDSNYGNVNFAQQSSPKHFHLHKIITQYAYDKEAYWLFQIKPDKNVPTSVDTIHISADATWLACREECVDESLTISLDIPIQEESVVNNDWKSEFTKAQQTFPLQQLSGSYSIQHGKLYMQIPAFTSVSPSTIQFIPHQKDITINNIPVNFNLTDNNFFIEAPLQKDAVVPSDFRAIILSDAGSYAVVLKQTDHSVYFPTSESFLFMLLLAFFGGIILNCMPCIFPILFIKALHLVNSSYSRKKIAIESLFYFLGVIISFLAVAVFLWLLRLGGEVVGWGFQLQSPVFVAFLFILFFVIGLLFLDIVKFNGSVFNRLGVLNFKNLKLNAFLTGFLSVLIASPCSAPFMGSAIGYSITQPPYIYFPIFLALAVGYALPFTLVGLSPKVLSGILPKPGKWMSTLKKLFAIPVFATCMWLGWVFYSQVTPPVPIWQQPDSMIWETFSSEKLASLQQQKRPVFIDFTAKWCLTCLVNEKTALNSRAFKRLVKEKNITLLKADWTAKDSLITSALAQYGRNSVPLYVYYDGKSTQPTILPQILTVSILKRLLQ